MKSKIILCFFISVICLYGCGSIKNITKPAESYQTIPYKPTISSIYLPIKMKQEALVQRINKQMTGLLYEDNNMADDNLMVKVWKRDNISLSITGTTIDYRLPLRVWLRTGVTKFGFTLAQDLEIELALKYRTVFAIKPNWDLECSTVSAGYEWLSDPYIDVKGVKIPVKTIASGIINRSQDKLCKMIDEQAKQYINIRQYVQDAWAQLQQPILLNPTYHVWLQLTPTEINLSPFTTDKGIVSTHVGMQAISEVFIASSAPLRKELSFLPSFKMMPKVPNELKLNIGIELPYKEAEQMAAGALVGKSFEQDGRRVTVKEIQLYGSNGKAVVSTLLEGSFNGRIYLTGIPEYNSEKKAIEIGRLDFDIETRNVLLKSAGWLFKSGILKRIAEKAVFPIGEDLSNAQATANANLSNNQAVKNMTLNGHIDKMDVSDIVLSPDAFKIIGVAEGQLDVSIDGLDF